MTQGRHARHSERLGELGVSRSGNANWGSGAGCHHRNSKSVHAGRREGREHVCERIADEVRAQELHDGETTACDHEHRPDGPDGSHTTVGRRDVKRQYKCQEGQLSTHRGRESLGRQVGDRAQHGNRRAKGGESDWRRVEHQREHDGVERRKADRDEHRTCDRYRCPKSCNALEQCAEAETDDDQNHAPITRQRRDDPIRQDIELSRRHGDVVQQQRGEHDPQQRPHREDRAVGDRRARAQVESAMARWRRPNQRRGQRVMLATQDVGRHRASLTLSRLARRPRRPTEARHLRPASVTGETLASCTLG
jgi:hypothetical protein